MIFDAKAKLVEWLTGVSKKQYKSPPPQSSKVELAVFPWPTWETLETVRGALIGLQLGQLRAAALLWDVVISDDRIGSAIRKRSTNLLGNPMEFDPANSSPLAGRMAKELELRWWQMYPESSVAELLEWGNGLGVAFGQMVWEPSGGEWINRLKVWHASNGYFNLSTRRFNLITQNAGTIEIDPEDPEWIVYTPFGADNKFWRHALIRSLALLWILRKWVMRDWGRFSEVHGLPIRKGYVPPTATQQEKDDFWTAMQRLSSESVFRLPLMADGTKGFDIDLIEAKSTSWEGIKELKKELDTMIDIDALGQNLMQQAGDKGSFAASKQHGKTENKNTMFDAAALSTALRNGPIKYWAGWNYPDGENLAPWARWQVEEPEDLEKKAKIWNDVSTALVNFLQAGVAIDMQAMGEDFNIELRGDGILDLHAVPGALQGDDEDEPQPGDTADPEDPNPDEQLSARPRRRQGHVRGQFYVDQLHERSMVRGAEALSTDVRVIVRAIASSDTPDELKVRLKELFKRQTPEEFASVVRRALLMAQLAGRLSAKR